MAFMRLPGFPVTLDFKIATLREQQSVWCFYEGVLKISEHGRDAKVKRKGYRLNACGLQTSMLKTCFPMWWYLEVGIGVIIRLS